MDDKLAKELIKYVRGIHKGLEKLNQNLEEIKNNKKEK